LVGSDGNGKRFCTEVTAKTVTKFLMKHMKHTDTCMRSTPLMKYWDTYDKFGCGVAREDLGDPGVDGRIILRCIIRKWDVEVWIGSSWFRIGTVGGNL
jgi:hypothetical protein